jgi:hypothetical protein
MPGGPFIIILILILAPMILGAMLKMYKAYQEEVDKQSQRKRARPVPTVPVSTSSAATGRGSGEIDRFLQEIDKLRQKADKAPVKVAPVKAVPVKVTPRAEPAPFVTTAPIQPRRDVPTELPVAKAVAPATSAQIKGASIGGALAPKVTVRAAAAPTTPFGRNLVALLSNSQSIPMAVVLQEVLGPPKGRQ